MKNKKGITLIALIITIIVLLILAGVSISIMIGDNGVIKQAQTAKDKTDLANAQTAIETVVATLQTEYMAEKTTNVNADIADVFTVSKLKKELSQLGYELVYEPEITSIFGTNKRIGTTFTTTIKSAKDENKYKITLIKNSKSSVKLLNFESGNSNLAEIKFKVNADIMSNAINQNIESVKDFYAHEVMYNGDSDWQIFYVGNEFSEDGKNYVYLISKSDRLDNGYRPNSKFQSNNIGIVSDVNKLSAWWKEYGEMKVTENDNAKAVAGLLNVNNWSDYYDSNVAKWAIGGPTEDIFLRSWNQSKGLTNGNGFTYNRKNIDFEECGYIWNRLGIGSYANYSVGDFIGNKSKNVNNESMDRKGNFLYYEEINTNEQYLANMYNSGYIYWFASSDNSSDKHIRFLSSEYDIIGGNGGLTVKSGIRPLICLKSNAIIEENEEGTWIINIPSN